MIVGWKDGGKLFGVCVVALCAVTVCTCFLGFIMDMQSVSEQVSAQVRPLYEAQLAVARFSCAVAGGFLAPTAVVMLSFYIRLYIARHSAALGVLKALGYPRGALALRFSVFGLAVLIGCAIGFGAGAALSPAVYGAMQIEGMPAVPVRFHAALCFFLVGLPALAYTGISCLLAFVALRRSAAQMLRGQRERRVREGRAGREKERAFLKEMRARTVTAKNRSPFLSPSPRSAFPPWYRCRFP